MRSLSQFKRMLVRLHRDERGGVSLETILIIGAIALPILIWIIKYGWPKIRNYFDKGMLDLQGNTDKTTQGQ
jgi:Flp pilus assembly pilin Flp